VSDPPPPAAPLAPRRGGVLLAVASGVALGVTIPFAKRAFAGVPPLVAGGWLYVCGGLACLPAAWRARGRADVRLRGGDLRFLLPSALVGCVVAPLAYVRGLALLPAHVVGLLVNLEAVFGVLVAVLVFRERLTRARAVGVALLVAGAVVTAALAGRGAEGDGRGASLEGVLLVAAACLAWAFDTNLLAPVSTREPGAVVVVHNLAGGAAALVLGGALGTWPWSIGAHALALGASVGFIGYGLSLYLLLRALARLRAARTNALFLVVSAVTGVVASALVAGEHVPAWIVGPLALIVLGARSLARPSRDERAGPGTTA